MKTIFRLSMTNLNRLPYKIIIYTNYGKLVEIVEKCISLIFAISKYAFYYIHTHFLFLILLILSSSIVGSGEGKWQQYKLLILLKLGAKISVKYLPHFWKISIKCLRLVEEMLEEEVSHSKKLNFIYVIKMQRHVIIQKISQKQFLH